MFVLKYLISIVFVHFFHFYIVFGLKEQPNRIHVCLTTPHTIKKVDKYIKECQEDVKVNILREAFKLLHHSPTSTDHHHDDKHIEHDHDHNHEPINIDEIFNLIQHSELLNGRHPELDKNVEITHATHADKWNFFSHSSHDHPPHPHDQHDHSHDHSPPEHHSVPNHHSFEHSPHGNPHEHHSHDHILHDHPPHDHLHSHPPQHPPHTYLPSHENSHPLHDIPAIGHPLHAPPSPHHHGDILHSSAQPDTVIHDYGPNKRVSSDSVSAAGTKINMKQLFEKFNKMKSSQTTENKYINFELEPHEMPNRRNDTEGNRKKRWAPNFQFIHPTTISSPDKRIAGCVMHCLFNKNDAINKYGWPTLDGLVNFYTEGVHEHGFFMAALRATDFCLTGALFKHHANRYHHAAMPEKCDLSFDVFDCISDKITEYCSEHHYHEHDDHHHKH